MVPAQGSGGPIVTSLFDMAPPARSDVPFLYALATAPETAHRWRLRGHIPSIEQFEPEIWRNVLTQFVVRPSGSSTPVGLVVCYNADMGDGFAYVGAAFVPGLISTGFPMNAVARFIQHLFGTWSFRKLYFEVAEYNFDSLRSGAGELFEVEAKFSAHDFSGGRYWDKYVLAVTRERAARHTPALLGGTGAPATPSRGAER